MSKDLNFLLFKWPVGQKGKPSKASFFRFQSELAQALIESHGHYKGREIKNMRPYLNQVLKKGGTPYEKPMSYNLRTQILEILRSKLLESDPIYDNLEIEFDKSYRLLKQEISQTATTLRDGDYEEFMEWSLNANQFTTLLNDPGEILWTQDRESKDDIDYLLNRLVELIFKNYHDNEKKCLDKLVNSGSSLDRTKTQYSYHIYVSSISTAIRFWEKLISFFIIEKLSEYDITLERKIEVVCNFFEFFNSTTNDRTKIIKVSKIDGYLTTVPLLYCQSREGISFGGIEEKEQMFMMNLDQGILKQVMKLPSERIQDWKENIYYRLGIDAGRKKFGVEEIDFKENRQVILNNLNFFQ